MLSPDSHVLICRTDNIGDVVLTLPLAGYLKRLHPALKISLLCRAYTARMLPGCSALDHVVELEQLDRPAEQLKHAGIDVIIFAKPHRRLAVAAKKAGIRHRVGTSHRWFHWLYCNRLAHFSRVKSPLHEAQLNFELLRPLGIDHIPDLAEIPPLYRFAAPPNAGGLRLSREQFNLIIHPKSKGNGREWPIDHYTALARLLQKNEAVKLWLTGSEDEGKWIEENAPELLAMPNVTNACGRFTLDQLASFIQAADGLVASGTGPLHMSAALGKCTLGLFPPIPPIHAGRWGALGERAQVLCRPAPCKGCNNAQTCICMKEITPEQVANVVSRWREEVHRQ